MAYDFPNRIKYTVPVDLAFSADTVNIEFAIRGPKGKAGRLYDYGFEGVTTAVSSHAASVLVGTTADDDAYGDNLAIQNLAAEDANSVRATYLAKGVPVSTSSTDVGDFIIDGMIPANQKVILTAQTASTDGTGVGTAFCIIDWQE